MLCLPFSGYDVSVEGLCMEVDGCTGLWVDLDLDIWIFVQWFVTQIMSRSCNVVRRHNSEDQDAVLDHSEELSSHTRCNVNLRVNLIELCVLLYCVVWLQVSEPALPRGGASFPQSRPRDLPAARRNYHKTRNILC